jgi:hypothetical protein
MIDKHKIRGIINMVSNDHGFLAKTHFSDETVELLRSMKNTMEGKYGFYVKNKKELTKELFLVEKFLNL